MQIRSPLARLLAALLQLAPWFNGASATTVNTGSQIAITIFRWFLGGAAVSGVFHGVSGASIVLTSPAGGSVRATNGVDVAFRVSMTYTEGSSASTPAVYDTVNLPPGLNPPTKSGTIWRITGRPTQSGVFSNVKLTGYEKTTRVGHQATVPLTITVVDAVQEITGQPAGLSVKAGQAATLSVTATGGSLTYQWLKGDLEVPNATSATVIFAATQESNSGSYRVRVTNSIGSILSTPALLTVVAGNPVPEFTTTPGPTSVHTGESLVLRASATGDGQLVWSWLKDGIPLPGQTNPSLSIPAASTSDSGTYIVTVTSSGGSSSAPGVRVTVTSPLHLDPPTAWGGMLLFDFVAITNRIYSLEMAPQGSPSTWSPIAEGTVTANPEPSTEVPLRLQVLKPISDGGLFRIRAH